MMLGYVREMCFSLTPFSFDDAEVVSAQLRRRRFSPDLILGVARRCRFGAPQVLFCRALDGKGRPFPTAFWLCCPHLTVLCGRVESEGGVRALEEAIGGAYSEWVGYHEVYARVRLSTVSDSARDFMVARRGRMWGNLNRGGVGGIRLSGVPTVKCLHLQTASWLSLRGHPGGAWLGENVFPLSCDNFYCGC